MVKIASSGRDVRYPLQHMSSSLHVHIQSKISHCTCSSRMITSDYSEAMAHKIRSILPTVSDEVCFPLSSTELDGGCKIKVRTRRQKKKSHRHVVMPWLADSKSSQYPVPDAAVLNLAKNTLSTKYQNSASIKGQDSNRSIRSTSNCIAFTICRLCLR